VINNTEEILKAAKDPVPLTESEKLPPKRELNTGSGENAKDPTLVRILVAAKAVLRDAYRLCSDTSPDRKMT
jgi:hypothetical protein